MRYAIGPGSGGIHPLAPTENRRGHHPKHPARSIVVEFQLPTATALLLLLGSLLRVSFKAVLTPAPEKQWWLRWGVFRCRSCGIISPLFGKTLAINSSPIPPQHKPPSGAKSGLEPCTVATIPFSL